MDETTYQALQEVVIMAYESGIAKGNKEKEGAIALVEKYINKLL